MLRRLVSQERLDRGLWGSADAYGRLCMALGAVLLALSCGFLFVTEGLYLDEVAGLDGARGGALVEGSCSGSGTDGPGLVHLENCAVTGMATFSSEFPGLEFLAGFNENLPAQGVTGAYFKVHMQRHSRRRSASWKDVSEPIANLRPAEVYSAEVRIGSHGAAHGVAGAIPGSQVPLAPSTHYQQETGWLTRVTPPYGSRNMQVYGDALYTSDPKLPFDDDVKLWFTVGNTTPVSVLADSGPRGGLLPWRLKSGWSSSSVDLTRVEGGAVSSAAMMEGLLGEKRLEASAGRILGGLGCWLGTWMLLFPARCVRCTSEKGNSDMGGDAASVGRAAPVSLLLSFAAIAAARVARRAPWMAAATALVLLALLLATCFHPGCLAVWEEFRQWRAAWSLGERPTVGARVRARASGRAGLVVACGDGGHPYEVRFDDGATEWLADCDVQCLDGDAPAPPTVLVGETAAPAAAPLPDSRQTGLLEPLVGDGAVAAAASGGASTPQSWQRMLLLGVGAALALCLLGALAMALLG